MLKPTTPIRQLPQRSAFTLVELMIVIAILGVLATLSLVVLRNSTEQAKESATRSRIQKIETILQMQLENYETRQLPISNDELLLFIGLNPRVGQVETARLLDLRRRIFQDLINVEMPRWPDFKPLRGQLGFFPSRNALVDAPGGVSFLDWLNSEFRIPYSPNPGVVKEITLAERLGMLTASSADLNFWRFNDNQNLNLSGEYLYLLLSRINYDGVPAIETFNKNSFADTDSDGLMEIVDAWGDPLDVKIFQLREGVVDYDWGRCDYKYDPVTNTSIFNVLGFDGLNPVIPRELGQIRVKVASRNVDCEE
jgi:prepilin-type N-terminal cleavage/methylation domain-containing protein